MWQFNRFGVILRVVSAISIIFIGATPTDGACNPQFVDQSDVFTSESINGVVAGWMDFDGDGDEDFLFCKGAICPDPFGCSSPRVKVFRNEGGLALVDVTDDLFGSAPLGSHGMAWGDMDNDGDLDLFLPLKRSLPPPFFSNELWRNDGNEFVEIALPPIRNVVDPLYAAWIDYDNDGLLDLYLGGEVNRFHRNLGDSTFEEGPPLPETIDGASGMAWGDFDGDGDLDLLRTSALSTNTLYRNDGEGVFSVVSSQPIEDPGRSSSACWGDYDGDGDLDLVVGNGRLDSDPPEDGGDRLLRNDGSGVFSDVTPPELADTKDTQSIRWVDFDNDGDLDLSILYEQGVTLTATILCNLGDDNFEPTTVLGPLSDSGALAQTWADWDGDGDVDFALPRRSFFEFYDWNNILLRNDLPQDQDHRWLEVVAQGVESNRQGVGATVRVVAKGKNQVRNITGGTGSRSQEPFRARFGLGSAEVVDTLEVSWPSGAVSHRFGVETDQRITVLEPTAASTDDRPSTPDSKRLLVSPNPMTTSVVLSVVLEEQSAVSLEVLDVTGRLVDQLLDSDMMEAGTHSFAWEPTGLEHTRVASGVYFAKATINTTVHTERLILIRSFH